MFSKSESLSKLKLDFRQLSITHQADIYLGARAPILLSLVLVFVAKSDIPNIIKHYKIE